MSHSGDLSDLEEIVSVLDSKNKKGIQYIFNQDYFTNPQISQDGIINANNSHKKSNKALNLNTKEGDNNHN